MPTIASLEVGPLKEPTKGGTYALETLEADNDLYRQISSDFREAGLLVESIECLQKFDFWESYNEKRETLIKRASQYPNCKVNETYLYHSTSVDEKYLCEEGFDETLKSDGPFGHGFYFSDTPKRCIASDQTNIIVVARVMLGDTKVYDDGKTDSLLKEQPKKDASMTGWRFYDSVKGRPENEIDYVIYRSQLALIEFIVKFTENKTIPEVPSCEPQTTNIEPRIEEAATILNSVKLMDLSPLVEPEREKIYFLTPLPVDSDLHRQISSDFKRARLVVKTIEHLQNHNCWSKYTAAKKQLVNRTPKDPAFKLNETYLYHGTNASKKDLCEEGFDVRLAKDGCFGKGIYFSDSPKKSKKYSTQSKLMLVARVVLGETKKYENGQKDRSLIREPLKEEPVVGWKYYDSVMGCPRNEMEFVVYSNENILIEYIIEFSNMEKKHQDGDDSASSSDSDNSCCLDSDGDDSASSSDSDNSCCLDSEKKTKEDECKIESLPIIEALPEDSVIPYFTIPEGELSFDQKRTEYKRVTSEEDEKEADSMLTKSGGDLERAIFLFFAYKQVKEEEAKRQAGQPVEDDLIEDDGSPIFPPMEPEYESEAWKQLNKANKTEKMNKMIADFLTFTLLDEAHRSIAQKYVDSAKYNMDTAVVNFYKSWF